MSWHYTLVVIDSSSDTTQVAFLFETFWSVICIVFLINIRYVFAYGKRFEYFIHKSNRYRK